MTMPELAEGSCSGPAFDVTRTADRTATELRIVPATAIRATATHSHGQRTESPEDSQHGLFVVHIPAYPLSPAR